MKTTYRIRQPYADIFMECAEQFKCNSPVYPERFIRKMKENTGSAGSFFGITDENGLEKKNPVIVALGDSVTAGHFESLMTPKLLQSMGEIFVAIGSGTPKEEIAEMIQNKGGLPLGGDARKPHQPPFSGRT